MERKIKTIPKEKMKGIKAMSPFMIDEMMLLGLRLFNNKEGETINNIVMTKEEIKKFLDNTKVYVNGKSEEIQKKLFSFGYYWYNENLPKVMLTEMPFLFIESDEITSSCDMRFFKNHKFTEITDEQILSLELTEGYRPFKDKNECWNEMLKHQPFGWVKAIESGDYYEISGVHEDTDFEHYARRNTFADGTPFGIKED